jgi:hypothetical protein
MFTGIHRHGYQGKQQHAEKKCNQDFFQYVPVYFFHKPLVGSLILKFNSFHSLLNITDIAKEMNIDERICE